MRRLFVPLSTEPYRWFEDGSKSWELRRERGAFSEKHLVKGRLVELRRGYSTRDSLYGSIGSVIGGNDIRSVLEAAGFSRVIPHAASLDDAEAAAMSILGPEPGPFVAFEVVFAAVSV